MRYCKKCGIAFPIWMTIEGKQRNLGSRRFCLQCSPLGKHNTRDLTRDSVTHPDPSIPLVCKLCGRKSPEATFYLTTGHRRCKACVNKLKLERDVSLKKKAIEYKGGRCLRCGYTGHYAAFVFHHLRDKAMTWNMMRNTSWLEIRKELDKCELLCANCHQIIHTKNCEPVA